MTDYDLVGLPEIAEMVLEARGIEVTTEAIRRQARTLATSRYRGLMPEPVAVVSGYIPVWKRKDIEKWMESQ